MHKNVKNGLKPKRSVKQLANDRRLGRMAKKRGKKKVSRKKATRRKNPSRYGSYLFVVFKYSNGKVYFFDGANWNSSKGKAALFKSQKDANLIARGLSLKMSYNDPTRLGVTHESTTVAEIKSKMTGKA